MKILLIRCSPSSPDVINRTYNLQEVGLAKALVRKGHICSVLYWTEQEERDVSLSVDQDKQITVFYRRGYVILNGVIYRNAQVLYREYDVLQTSEYDQFQSWLLARKYPSKTIIYHGPYYSAYNKRYNLKCKIFDCFFLSMYRKKSTRFLVKSRLAAEFLHKKRIEEDNIQVMGVGLDPEMISEDTEENGEILSKMKERKDTMKLLYVGRIEPRRNIFFLLDVFCKVLRQEPEAILFLIGTGEQQYMDSVLCYAKEHNIDASICWQEKMEQKYLYEIYQHADFFLLPTEYEIFGMVLLEAMFSKLVVVTTDNGGSGTLIENRVNGYILDNKNSDKWVDCIINAYHDKEQMHIMGEKAREVITEEFTWDRLADKFINQYMIHYNN